MKILVIEDEKLLADSIKAMLEAKGFTVEVAYNGEDGLAYAELGLYDLLILDVMMPKMDGLEVARRVRKSRCNTPILMLTARSEVQDRIAGLNAGADYYLTKPFDSGELRRLRRRGLQSRKL
ncbi:MAG: response regulator [Oscillospiraceae bacterium]|nr:response regulator [Oscillospiraceae bacterium]